MEEKKELSIGQEIVKEVAGDVCGLGAGVLVGGVALASIDLIPGLGKGLKLILKLGAYGLEIKTLFDVKNAVGNYTETVFDAIGSVKAIFGGTEKKDEPVKVQVEGAIQ